MLKDIQSHVDNAGVRAIMKALKTHCPPFKDYDGKFLRSCVQKDLQIYIFTFKTTATFTKCHTNKKYHALVPVPPSLTICVLTSLKLPFNPTEFLPTLASDECSITYRRPIQTEFSHIKAMHFLSLFHSELQGFIHQRFRLYKTLQKYSQKFLRNAAPFRTSSVQSNCATLSISVSSAPLNYVS